MLKKTLLLLFTFSIGLQAQQSDFNTIGFTKADSIAAQYKGEDLYNLPILALKLTSSLETEVEKFRSIYFWVCHNIKGDPTLMHNNEFEHQRLKGNPSAIQRWQKGYKRKIFKILREEKVTLCTGYAYLLQELSNLAGLECVIVQGYGKTKKIALDEMEIPNHSWNAVQLDGTWYLCDPTWSSGILDIEKNRFQHKFDEQFFLTEPTQFAKDHRPVDNKWSLLPQN